MRNGNSYGSNSCQRCGSNPCRCILCIQGETGATGTIIGSYATVTDIQRAQPAGKPGEHYLVGRDVYGYDPITNSWKYVGPLGGPTGPAGPAGASPKLTIGPNGNWFADGVDTGVPASGSAGGAQAPPPSIGANGNWFINGLDSGVPARGARGLDGPNAAVTIGTNGNWLIDGVDSGVLSRGPTGSTGPEVKLGFNPNGNWTVNGVDSGTSGRGARGLAGVDGPVGRIVGAYPSLTELRAAHPTAPVGEMYLIGTNVFSFIPATNSWRDVGSIAGPPGPAGANGAPPAITVGTNGNWFIGGVDSGSPAKGATGPKGPIGAVKGSYSSPGELQTAKPTGPAGDFYLIGRDLYSFDPGTNSWKNIGPIAGPPGPAGPTGPDTIVTIGPNGNFLTNGIDSGVSSRGATGATGPTGNFVGSYPSVPALQAARPTGRPGEYYLINKRVYGFDPITNGWREVGPMMGPTGPTGPSTGTGAMPSITIGPNGDWFINGDDTGKTARGATGDPGAVGAIVGSYPTQAQLQAAQPNGPQGVYYLIGEDLYGYNPDTRQWFRIGPIGGPTGPTGTSGKIPEMTVGTNGNWFIDGVDMRVPARGATGPKGATGVIKDSYSSSLALQRVKPSGPPGEFYIINRDLFSYDPAARLWKRIGPLAGPSGPTGPAGPNADIKIGPNGNWFINGLDSLTPARGPAGDDGPTSPVSIGGDGNWITNGTNTGVPARGPTGVTGPRGATGTVVITVGPNGDWFVDGADTGVPARGPTGPGSDVRQGPNGNWFINGVDTGVPYRGATGPTGATGVVAIGPTGTWTINGEDTKIPARGPTGATGATPIVNIGPNGNWLINGKDTNVPARGPRGATGAPGPAGATGGMPTITVGTNGNWVIEGVDTGVPKRGPTGATGKAPEAVIGPNGNWLVDGADTGVPANGPTGPTGPTGARPIPPKIEISPTNGNWIIDGRDTGVPSRGPTGPAGGGGTGGSVYVGPNGNWIIGGKDTGVPEKGPTGPTGPNPALYIGPNGNWFIENKDTGVPARGPTGPTGSKPTVSIGPNDTWIINRTDTGVLARGATGATGNTGPMGPAGATAAATIGVNGNWWINNIDTGVPARGTAGAPGAPGAPGATGATGPAGYDAGPGAPGRQGPTGPAGPAGSGSNLPFPPSSAVYSSMERGHYVDGSVVNGKVMPLRVENHTTNPSAYTLNGDGTVTINQTGDYLISGKVQSYNKNDINADTYAIQVDGSNYKDQPESTKTFTTYRGDNNEVGITTVMHLNAGQKISLSQITTPRTYGGGFLGAIYSMQGRGSGKGGADLTTRPGGNQVDTPTLGLAITRVG